MGEVTTATISQSTAPTTFRPTSGCALPFMHHRATRLSYRCLSLKLPRSPRAVLLVNKHKRIACCVCCWSVSLLPSTSLFSRWWQPYVPLPQTTVYNPFHHLKAFFSRSVPALMPWTAPPASVRTPTFWHQSWKAVPSWLMVDELLGCAEPT